MALIKKQYKRQRKSRKQQKRLKKRKQQKRKTKKRGKYVRKGGSAAADHQPLFGIKDITDFNNTYNLLSGVNEGETVDLPNTPHKLTQRYMEKDKIYLIVYTYMIKYDELSNISRYPQYIGLFKVNTIDLTGRYDFYKGEFNGLISIPSGLFDSNLKYVSSKSHEIKSEFVDGSLLQCFEIHAK